MISTANRKQVIGNRAFSLVEMIVVIAIFAIVAVLSVSSLSVTLKGSRKTESLIRVRESVNFATAVIERQIRNSESIANCTGSPTGTLNYTTLQGIVTNFTCVTPGVAGYIASDSARLTSSDISVTSCSFTCIDGGLNTPATVNVNIVAEDATLTGVDKGSVSTDIKIITRNY